MTACPKCRSKAATHSLVASHRRDTLILAWDCPTCGTFRQRIVYRIVSMLLLD